MIHARLLIIRPCAPTVPPDAMDRLLQKQKRAAARLEKYRRPAYGDGRKVKAGALLDRLWTRDIT
jgi:hypothetical protein